MDWYRNDFNIDPLPFWRRNDPADRQGMTEIRYVEGHYAMWDAMIASKPGLFIDNCASGGRRIDLETIQRSVALWRSDTGCGAGRGDWHQAQAFGMNYYLPLNEICAWTPNAYEMRSDLGTGAIVQFAFLDSGFSIEAARQALAEVKENQKYFYGDFYPLTECSTDPSRFLAYQVHRADLGAGLVLAFRRAKCNTAAISVTLGGIEPQSEYKVEFIDEQRQKTVKTMSGRGLATDLSLMIPQRGASLLVPLSTGREVNAKQPAHSVCRPPYGPNRGTFHFGGRHTEFACSLISLLQCLDQAREHRLGVAEEHERVVGEEQLVLDAGKPGVHAPLDDEHRLGLVGVDDRHAEDGARLVVPGGRIHDVVGPQHQGHVGLRHLGVDLLHLDEAVVRDLGLGQQDVHVARHAAGDRVHGELHCPRRAW